MVRVCAPQLWRVSGLRAQPRASAANCAVRCCGVHGVTRDVADRGVEVASPAAHDAGAGGRPYMPLYEALVEPRFTRLPVKPDGALVLDTGANVQPVVLLVKEATATTGDADDLCGCG